MSLDTHTAERIEQPVAVPEWANHYRCGCYTRQFWGVIHTHPQAELWATENLKRQGYTTYLPLYLAKRRDRVLRTLTKLVERPLFPSYAFVQFGEDDPWYPIRRTPGVRQLILSEFGKPYHLRAGAVEALQAAEAARRCHPAEKDTWAPGTPVALAGGMWDGIPGIVLKTEKRIALVSMLMFGHLREIAVSFDCLRPRDV